VFHACHVKLADSKIWKVVQHAVSAPKEPSQRKVVQAVSSVDLAPALSVGMVKVSAPPVELENISLMLVSLIAWTVSTGPRLNQRLSAASIVQLVPALKMREGQRLAARAA